MIEPGKITSGLITKIKDIRVLLMDVDGVMTAGMIVYDSNGLEIKHFNAHDGLGLKLAQSVGLKTGVLSARDSGTIRTRATEIGMNYLYLGHSKKLPAFIELQQKLEMDAAHFCFIGDDLPDVPVMKAVGLAVAVNNAMPMVKEHAHYVTLKKGGDGAVREVVELILNLQNKLEKAVQLVWEHGYAKS
ncbi:MAG: HAD hydrolase family protein [Calditrichia bacterium]